MIEDFLKYQAPTSLNPLGMEVASAKGSYIYDTNGKAYLDMVAGVSACTLGHCHPKVVSAIQKQAETYMHTMVYGEYAQAPAVEFCKLLAENLPQPLEMTYLVNSGTEAIEASMKLAKRATGRFEIIAAKNAYHGNTQGSLSIMDYELRKQPFRPLLPNISWIEFNNEADLEKITSKTAGVVLETIQGGAGFITPENDYLLKVKNRCKEVGAMLILDEIQPGFGRTGKLFGFQNYGIVPDILAIGKGMASGLPCGAVVSSRENLMLFADKPKMSHITTFGGNPVIAAASLATLKELISTDLIKETLEKEKLFRKLLKHPKITEVRGKGLMLAAMVESEELANHIILNSHKEGCIFFWLLFEPKAVRISPPLTISYKEIEKACEILIKSIESF